MSGLEVLGAIASAAQLASYVVNAAAFLADVYERLKHAPERIAQHSHQITRLIDLVLLIKDNELLHQRFVIAQLQHTIQEAYNLQDLLNKALRHYTHSSIRKKYWKALKGKDENLILGALQNIEREKTGLTLCLTAAHTALLHDVHREVKRGANADMPASSSSNGKGHGKTNTTVQSPAGQDYAQPDPMEDHKYLHTERRNKLQYASADDTARGSQGADKKAAGPAPQAPSKFVTKDVVSEDSATQGNDFGKSTRDGKTTDIEITQGVFAKGTSTQTNEW